MSKSNLILVALMSVTVRRDAQTITPTTVPEYEVRILAKKFDKENVTVGEQVGTFSVDPESEHERLCAKYGDKAVKAVFGDDGGMRLAEIVAKSEVEAGPGKASAGLTIDQLKAALEAKGIEFTATAKKADLAALLDAAE